MLNSILVILSALTSLISGLIAVFVETRDENNKPTQWAWFLAIVIIISCIIGGISGFLKLKEEKDSHEKVITAIQTAGKTVIELDEKLKQFSNTTANNLNTITNSVDNSVGKLEGTLNNFSKAAENRFNLSVFKIIDHLTVKKGKRKKIAHIDLTLRVEEVGNNTGDVRFLIEQTGNDRKDLIHTADVGGDIAIGEGLSFNYRKYEYYIQIVSSKRRNNELAVFEISRRPIVFKSQ